MRGVDDGCEEMVDRRGGRVPYARVDEVRWGAYQKPGTTRLRAMARRALYPAGGSELASSRRRRAAVDTTGALGEPGTRTGEMGAEVQMGCEKETTRVDMRMRVLEPAGLGVIPRRR